MAIPAASSARLTILQCPQGRSDGTDKYIFTLEGAARPAFRVKDETVTETVQQLRAPELKARMAAYEKMCSISICAGCGRLCSQCIPEYVVAEDGYYTIPNSDPDALQSHLVDNMPFPTPKQVPANIFARLG